MSQPRFFPLMPLLWRASLPVGLLIASLSSAAAPADAQETPAAVSPLPDIETAGQRLGWLSAADIATLPPIQRPPLDKACHGAWVTPFSPRVYVGSPDASDVEAIADSLKYSDDSEANLNGQVVISQPGRRLEADSGMINRQRDFARLEGNVRLAEPGLLITGNEATMNLQTGAGQMQSSEFVSSAQHAHGQAERIRRFDNQVTLIEQGLFTTCAPGNRVWSLAARDIELNPNTGLATLHATKLRLFDVPVIYLPYYQFPLDSQRQSGFLQPTFRNSATGGLSFDAPFYWNIAPNMDATLVPRYFTQRGGMAQGEFRYLTRSFGSGEIRGGYLPGDQVTGTDRKSLSVQQRARFGDGWSASANYNYLSDKTYFIDLGRNLLSTASLFQERSATLQKDMGAWHLTTRAQSFQTVDRDILQINRPYARLPQVTLVRDRDLTPGLQTSFRGEAVNFSRRIDDNSGADVDGLRLRLDPEVRYDASTSWGFLRPSARFTHLQYQLNGELPQTRQAPFVSQPTLSLDSGLFLDRAYGNGVTQTLEPRLYYVYSPYRNQATNPVFDTVNNTFTYEQIFRASRFSGGDRVDDANQLSAGLTTRLLDSDGVERFQAGIGQILYFRDRLVQLNGANAAVATQPTSSYAGKLQVNFTENLSSFVDLQMDPERYRLSQYSITNSYLPRHEGSVINAGYRFRREDPTIGQKSANLALLSFVQPLSANWTLIGAFQYDTALNQSQQRLFGVSYESCCWQIRIIKRTLLIDAINTANTGERTSDALLFEVTLKGLGNSSGAVDKYLQRTISGYSSLKNSEDYY